MHGSRQARRAAWHRSYSLSMRQGVLGLGPPPERMHPRAGAAGSIYVHGGRGGNDPPDAPASSTVRIASPNRKIGGHCTQKSPLLRAPAICSTTESDSHSLSGVTIETNQPIWSVIDAVDVFLGQTIGLPQRGQQCVYVVAIQATYVLHRVV